MRDGVLVSCVPSVLSYVQAPEPDANDLSAEEVASVKLFQLNTPSVVNISNIGWYR